MKNLYKVKFLILKNNFNFEPENTEISVNSGDNLAEEIKKKVILQGRGIGKTFEIEIIKKTFLGISKY
ncbi:MAG: hypothetical protein GY849_02620 [Deltaproteobacteria bacterium]|nr:hypothetical protein [Deltaproteobacteria bacterium]